MSIAVRHNPDFLNAALREIRGAFTPAQLERMLRAPLLVLQAAIARSANERLAKDPTGALARSWEIELSVTTRGASGGVRSAVPYARIHNEGGEIRPKVAKHLAIPLADVPRGMRARDDPTPMRAWKSKRGNLILWDVGRGVPKPRYLLRDSVVLPGTRYLDIAIQASQDDAVAALEAAVARALDGAR